jgi:predicted NBD/HSP70 family sugar kinase
MNIRLYAVGIELRPYWFAAALCDRSGTKIDHEMRKLPDMRVDTVVNFVAATVEMLVARQDHGVPRNRVRVLLGLQLGARINPDSGTVYCYRKQLASERHFHWEDEVPLRSLLRERTGLEFTIANDADAFAVKEQWLGVGQMAANFAVMLIREGVGGAVVRDNCLFSGPVEIGNFITSHGHFRTNELGQVDTLESVAGTTGIVAEFRDATGSDASDINAAAEFMREFPYSEGMGAFTIAGLAAACGISYLINFAGASHMVLCGPNALLLSRKNAPAANEFLRQVGRFQDFVGLEGFKNCELVLRRLEPYDGAISAALVALVNSGLTRSTIDQEPDLE